MVDSAHRATDDPAAYLGPTWFIDSDHPRVAEAAERAAGCELYVNGKWAKATPAFNSELCTRFGVPPLEFDGTRDALMHAFDGEGARFMEYLNDRGTFPDVPYDRLMSDFLVHYPGMMAAVEAGTAVGEEPDAFTA
jgi:hypothetical protein